MITIESLSCMMICIFRYCKIIKLNAKCQQIGEICPALLVVIAYIALIFGHQSAHHGLIALVLEIVDVLTTLADGHDGLVDRQRQRMPVYSTPVTCAWHDIKRAVDRQRTNRQLKFVGQHERTTAENAHVTGKSAGTFRKDHQ